MLSNKVKSMDLIYYRVIDARSLIIKSLNVRQELEFKIVVLLLWKIQSLRINFLEYSVILLEIFNVGLWLNSISFIKTKMVVFMCKGIETKHSYLIMNCIITIK